jgi:hypothetical protein
MTPRRYFQCLILLTAVLASTADWLASNTPSFTAPGHLVAQAAVILVAGVIVGAIQWGDDD